jgi:DNA-binding HxlR family transcriptional regulator
MTQPDDEVDVLVEPAAGHTVEEVVRRLHEVGAADVQVLAPGFISARAISDALRPLEAMAVVHRKVTKAPPRPR